jgi:hypothetical protein
MSETRRDLNVDLAICNAATPGPWIDNGNEIVTESNRFVGIAGALTDEDNQFIAEARTGWPHAIERALAAEEEVERLRHIIDEALKSSEWGAYDDSLRSVVRILKEATADDQR